MSTHLSALTLKELLQDRKISSTYLEELATRANKKNLPRYHGRGYANRSKTWATKISEYVFTSSTIEELFALSIPAKEFLHAYLPDQYFYPKYSMKRNTLLFPNA